MSKAQRRARRKMLNRREVISPNTMLTLDSGQLLVTADSMRTICNMISKKIKRKLTAGEVAELDSFIGTLPPSQYAHKTLQNTQLAIADQYMTRHRMWQEIPEEHEDLRTFLRLDEQTTDESLRDVQREEIMGLTDHENSLKYTMHTDRNGRSVVARERAGEERIMRNRSTPNGLLNQEGRDLQGFPAGEIGGNAVMMRNQHRVNKELIKYLRTLNGMFNAEKIDESFARVSSNLTTYQNINLPRQVIPLDSRFRLVDYNQPGEIKWNIHTSNDPGRPGDIRMQDTVTEVMRIKICPFWIPVSNERYQFYDKIRMYIKEFKGQSIQVNEFEDCDVGCVPRVHNYHFEFLVNRQEVNRIYLTPVCDTFIFRKPMAQVNTITAVFRSPFEKIIFDADRLLFTVDHLNPAFFTSDDDHNLSTGDLVYVCGFNSGNAAIDKLMNDPAGHFITRLSDTEFTIPVDLTPLGAGQTVDIEVQFGSKRIVTQLELISLEQ